MGVISSIFGINFDQSLGIDSGIALKLPVKARTPLRVRPFLYQSFGKGDHWNVNQWSECMSMCEFRSV